MKISFLKFHTVFIKDLGQGHREIRKLNLNDVFVEFLRVPYTILRTWMSFFIVEQTPNSALSTLFSILFSAKVRAVHCRSYNRNDKCAVIMGNRNKKNNLLVLISR